MAEMTSLERVQTVLAGQMPDRVPVIPQGFMFSAKTAGYDIGAINRNPAKMAESHRISQEKYGYDGCVVDVDDATLAEACGAKVIFREQDVASVDEHHPVLEDLREIDDLKMPDPLKDGRICEWLETVERLKAAIGDHVFIMGRADQGPFSLLCLLRGTQEFMVDLLTEDELRALLAPTRLYHDVVYDMRKLGITPKAYAHITGGGLPENLERFLGDKGADLEIPYWDNAPVQKVLEFVDAEDRFHTFNMGIGWVAIVKPDQVETACKAGPGGTVIGTMREGKGIKVSVRK